jgi:mannosyl-3-phosphoglycerate phosphatase
MVKECFLLVFSDLDGTLIDHETYTWDAAQEALARLGEIEAGLVLASSKTASEVIPIRATLAQEAWPAIVENGAGLVPPFAGDAPVSSEYERIRSVLSDMPADLRQHFRGFGDLGTAELCQITGLDAVAAHRAQQRCFSEPGLWFGSKDAKTRFLAVLSAQGISAQQGGRFLTLSFGRNKVDQMRDIIKTYQPGYTVALGDAPNDISMLEHADFGIIVANPNGPQVPRLTREENGQIIRTQVAGPAGWNLAILELIDRLDLT